MYSIQLQGLQHSLKKEQNEDEHVAAIREIMSQKSYKDFVILNGLLYKMVNSIPLIVIPEDMEFSLITKIHRGCDQQRIFYSEIN